MGLDLNTNLSVEDQISENKDDAEKYLGAVPNIRTGKSKDSFIRQAKHMKYKIDTPLATLGGENNDGVMLVAKDKFGNNKGVWFKATGGAFLEHVEEDLIDNQENLEEEETLMNNEELETIDNEDIVDEVVQEEVQESVLFKIDNEDLNLSEQINGVFEGSEQLSEEFLGKATTLFESVVVSKVNDILAAKEQEINEQVEQYTEYCVEELTTKVDDYLNYVVESWTAENELAIDRGLKLEMTDEFLSGLKTLFEDHYVDIPDAQVDVVEELVEQVESLTEKLDESEDRNVALVKEAKQYERESIIANLSESLSDNEAEKLKSLAEGVGFEDIDDFKDKVNIIKDHYFTESKQGANFEVVDDMQVLSENKVAEEEQVVAGPMSNYVNAISSQIKK